ncbi:hypothetical protein ABZV31_37685 [Streptomyces sp. NPDC005202]|uniref:hypothetical protein n=1 Tax=Streptomyces sp. NPDC005202 TaxID=3157021 RepID=UPI0033B75730
MVRPADVHRGYAASSAGIWSSCPSEGGQFHGWVAVVALAVHRAVEGMALASGSVAVLAALVVHAAAEGAALAVVVGGGRRCLVVWTLLASASPGIGVLAIDPPTLLVPVLLALVAGVLAGAGWTALTAALRDGLSGRPNDPAVVAAVVAAGALTAVAVATSG